MKIKRWEINLICFPLIDVSTKKRMVNFYNNELSVLFWLIPRSTEKILDSFLKSFNIYESDGLMLDLIGWKFMVISASTEKLYKILYLYDVKS